MHSGNTVAAGQYSRGMPVSRALLDFLTLAQPVGFCQQPFSETPDFTVVRLFIA
jgi:hypothetical protein